MPIDDDAYARLPTEQPLRASRDLDALPPEKVIRLLLREERRVARAVEAAAPALARAARRCAEALRAGGRIVYVGAGTSGRLGTLDAAECPPTFGTRPGQIVAVMAGGPRALRRAVEGAEDRPTEARRALARLEVGGADVVVGIAASGVTPFARAGLEAARAAGAATVLITCAPEAIPGRRVAHVVIPLRVGPEVLAGSTRLKAGTATKLALNALSTTTMVLLGKCYGPQMVDLRAGSAKLRARARRMLAELADVQGVEADALLRAAGGQAKVAIVMARLSLSRRAAEARLAEAGGRLRRLLGPPPPLSSKPGPRRRG
jgi:N-acetylmuramic acid 6-phosphate etherase